MHLLAYAALLLVLVPVARLDSSFTSDEGGYALAAEAVHHGRWTVDYRASALDPSSRFQPVVNATVSKRGVFPYVQHPAYIRVLAWSRALFGQRWGLHLPMLLTGALAPVIAWLLARELKPDAGRLAFWFAAASPVLVNAFVLWAHAASALVGGVAVLAAVRLTRHGVRPTALAFVLGAVSAGVWLRSEGLLLAAALALGLVLARGLLRGLTALGVAASISATALLTARFEQTWVNHLVGPALPFRGVRQTSGSLVRGRLEGTWAILLRGGRDGAAAGVLAGLALVCVVVLTRAMSTRRPGWRTEVAVAASLFCVLWVARVVAAPGDTTTGLLAAWPILAVGAGLTLAASTPAIRLPLLVCGLFGVAVLATQYREGGGLEWGGRFLSPIIVPLAALAAAGVRACFERDVPDRLVSTALAAVVVVPALAGLVVSHHIRAVNADRAHAVLASGAEVVVSADAYLPNATWWTHGRVRWMVAPATDPSAPVREAVRRGVSRFALVWPASEPAPEVAGRRVSPSTGRGAVAAGWRLYVIEVP